MQHSQRFLDLVADAKTRIAEIDTDTVLERIENGEPLQIIDVREESEWAAGHVRGAVYLGRGILERDVEAKFPDLDTPLVLYCGGGFRSALSADSLRAMGYRKVWSLAGGWKAWRQAGGPTVG